MALPSGNNATGGREAKHPQPGHRLETHGDINTKEIIHTNSAVHVVNTE
jgi:hypothetical protein